SESDFAVKSCVVCFVVKSQSRTAPSQLADASTLPSDQKSIEYTGAACPARVAASLKEKASHRRIMLSSPAVAIICLSGDTATPLVGLACDRSGLIATGSNGPPCEAAAIFRPASAVVHVCVGDCVSVGSLRVSLLGGVCSGSVRGRLSSLPLRCSQSGASRLR